jgi:hypothetical protein
MKRDQLLALTPEERKYFIDERLRIYKESIGRSNIKKAEKIVRKDKLTRFNNKGKIQTVTTQIVNSLPNYDFLKYLYVIKYYARIQYEMQTEEFELLCRIYSEGPMSEYQLRVKTPKYDIRSAMMFVRRMEAKRFIDKSLVNGKEFYVINSLAKRRIKEMYEFMIGRVKISTDPFVNRIFEPHDPKIDKKSGRMRVRQSMIEMNNRIMFVDQSHVFLKDQSEERFV